MKTLLNKEQIKEVDKFYNRINEIERDYFQYWLDHTLWHWEFWLALILTTVPWIAWVIFRKKDSTARLLLVGLFIIFIGSWFDFLGVVLGLWHYTGKVLPVIPSYIPWDFSLLPVSVTLWMQYTYHWKPFLQAVIYSGLTSFVGEPIFEWLGMYSSEHWNPFYSFPIYIILYLMAYRLSKSVSFERL